MCSSLHPAIPDRVSLVDSTEPILLLTLPGHCHPHGPRAVKGLIVIGVPGIMQQLQDALLETPAFVHLA